MRAIVRGDPAISLARRRRFDGVPPRGAQRKSVERKDRRRGGCPLRDVARSRRPPKARDRGEEKGREPPPPPSRIGRGDRVVDEFDRGQDVSIDDAFISETRFVRNQHERKEKEETEQATNLRRSASLFYVVSSILFVVRRFVTPNTADGNEFLVVFDTVYTFVCLAFFAYNVQEKERLSRSSALLFGDAAVVAAANFLIAAATTDIQEIDIALAKNAPKSKIFLCALPSIVLVAFQVIKELSHFDDGSAEKKATIVRAEDFQATKGIDKKILGIKKVTVELKNIVPNWITVGKIASRSVRPLQLVGAILVNIDIIERTSLMISTGRSDEFVLFHGSWWTKDLSSIGSYAFVLASVMVFIQTSAEIQIERAKKLYVDEFESLETLEEFNRDP